MAVPLINPVPVFRASPVGRPGETPYEYGVTPPLALTGINGVKANPLVRLIFVTVVVAVNGGLVTTSVKGVLLVCPMLSVADTV